MCVELRPFNDRQFNRDLVRLCERVNTVAPQLPDGRRLLFQEVSLFAINASKVRLTPLALAARRVGSGAAPRRSPPLVGHLAR